MATATAGGAAAVAAAMTQRGKPYRFAQPVRASTRNPGGFDCSGLTMWAWYQAGAKIKLGHYTGTQWTQTAKRPLAQAQPGDLVFYGAGVPHHVALYIGNGQIIDAPDQGMTVRVTKVHQYGDARPTVGIFPGSNGGTGVAQSPMTTIYEYLRTTLGFSAAGAAGALGNFDIESDFNPNASNPREGAIGIAQWEGGRRAALQRYAAAHGGKETDLAMQLGYLGQELRGGYSKVLDRLRTSTDAGDAAAYFDANYEVSSGAARADRISSATTIYQQIQTGSLATFAGGNSDAPFPPSALKAPLSASQRKAAIAYIKKHWSDSQGGSVPVDNSTPDARVIAYYGIVYAGSSGTASPGDIVGDIANDAIGLDGIGGVVTKAAFTLAGLGLVLIGAAATARSKGLMP